MGHPNLWLEEDRRLLKERASEKIIRLYNFHEVATMHTTSLRRVGGSVMLAVPPAVLDLLDLEVGTVVGMRVDGERLVIECQRRPRYTVAELLSQCDFTSPMTEEERKWVSAAPAGEETL